MAFTISRCPCFGGFVLQSYKRSLLFPVNEAPDVVVARGHKQVACSDIAQLVQDDFDGCSAGSTIGIQTLLDGLCLRVCSPSPSHIFSNTRQLSSAVISGGSMFQGQPLVADASCPGASSRKARSECEL